MSVVVRKREGKSGIILYVDIHHDGRRKKVRLPTTDMREARKIATEMEQTLRNEGWGIQRNVPRSLKQFVEEYLVVSEGTKAQKTFQTDRVSLRSFCRQVGEIDLAAITFSDVESFKLERMHQIKPTSVNVALRHLKAAFSYAVRKGYIKENPASKVTLCRASGKNLPRFLTDEEVQCLRGAAKEDIRLLRMINLMLWTGMRRKEVTSLQWSDVDLGRGFITVQNKAGFQTKSGKARIIPINDELKKMLKAMSASKPSPDYPVCELGYWWFGTCFKLLVQKAGLHNGITLHSLRHTFASHLVMQGVDLVSIKEILGHHDISVTMIYSHLTPDHLSQTVNRLPY